MSDRKESAPVRGVAFGLGALVLGYMTNAIHTSGVIDLKLRAARTPAVFSLSREIDGWHFNLAVLLIGALTLACLVAAGLAVRDLLARDGETA